jgi:hypothetical protein
MSIRSQFISLFCSLLLPAASLAQSIPGDVTFVVPVNLALLYPDITMIAVECSISSDAIPLTPTADGGKARQPLVNKVELPVSAGRLASTVMVVVAVPSAALIAPTGKLANYQCRLSGYSTATKFGRGDPPGSGPIGWGNFDANHINPSFRVSPTPAPITGSFTW